MSKKENIKPNTTPEEAEIKELQQKIKELRGKNRIADYYSYVLKELRTTRHQDGTDQERIKNLKEKMSDLSVE